MKKLLISFILFSLLAACVNVNAEVSETENTYKYIDGSEKTKATLTDITWLVGSWKGQAFGSSFEETWNPASNGSMVGMFKLLDEDKVGFYELMLIVEEEGSLVLKVKHFNADFSGWEEKADYISFPLVKIEKAAVHFSGLSFNKISDLQIDAYLAMYSGDTVSEEKLIYTKVVSE